MRIAHIKTITILIAGAVLTAGFMMGFGSYVFAGDPIAGIDISLDEIPGGRVSTKNYSSSLSKTKSIGLVRMEVGDVLLRYGVGGAEINKVTEALEGKGVYEAELKRFLLAIGMNEQDTQNILLEFDKIGISKDGAQGLDSPEKEFTTGDPASVAGQPGAGQIEKGVSTPDAIGASPSAAEGTIKDILPSKRAEPAPATTLQQPSAGVETARTVRKTGSQGDYFPMQNFKLEVGGVIQDLKAAESKERREDIRKELAASRQTLQESVETLRQNLRENAQDLRDNFRTEYLKYELKDVRVVSFRIALAHGKGLRMINRYRSAMTRFDHILGRLESRIEKIGIENEAQARATEKGKIKDYFPASVTLLIEEAKNTQALNKAKLAELEAKYESLLLGKNPGGIAQEARVIAQELKAEIEKLHGLLDDIRQATGTINTTKSNTF